LLHFAVSSVSVVHGPYAGNSWYPKRMQLTTTSACEVLLQRCVNAILIKELIELLVERMAGRWRELFGSNEKRFRLCLAFGQSQAESPGANVASENSPVGECFNGLLPPRIRERESGSEHATTGMNPHYYAVIRSTMAERQRASET
jgi:hypothetical protein